jgi:hypothetical protein
MTELASIGAPSRVAPPSEIQAACRCLLWSSEPRRKPDGSTYFAKVPRYIDGDRRRGDLNNDAGRLATYAEAIAALALWADAPVPNASPDVRMAGVGFALGADGRGGFWQGIDFDKLDERPELISLVTKLPGYVELSPSLRGVHAIGYGTKFDTLGSNASGIEAYCEGRFFTLTGFALSANPGYADRWAKQS